MPCVVSCHEWNLQGNQQTRARNQTIVVSANERPNGRSRMQHALVPVEIIVVAANEETQADKPRRNDVSTHYALRNESCSHAYLCVNPFSRSHAIVSFVRNATTYVRRQPSVKLPPDPCNTFSLWMLTPPRGMGTAVILSSSLRWTCRAWASSRVPPSTVPWDWRVHQR